MTPRILGVLAALLVLSLPATAGAVHWPFFGGDAGRSGLQPVDEGATPVRSAYSLTDAAQRNVVTPIITTAGGGPSVQRVAFGTDDANRRSRVHLRTLATGAPVGDAAGILIDEGGDQGAFGRAGDGFADSSTATALGQLFVVHNDDGAAAGDADVEIAQIDEADGTLVKQVDVAGTDGVNVDSAAVLTGPDPSGGRVLFFVGSNGELFRIPIANAARKDATFGAATRTSGADATSAASPTFLNLRDAQGVPTPHVAVGTRSGSVRSYRVANLARGPESERLAAPGLLGQTIAQTPSVPVGPDGFPPGQVPSIYVALDVSEEEGLNPLTTVHKLSQQGNSMSLVERNQSAQLQGRPAPAIAVSEKASAGAPSGGKVVVTTSENLYTLNTSDLAGEQSFARSSATGAETAFGANVALVSGQFVYVASDRGRQLVLRLADAQPVPASEFAPAPGSSGAGEASGQPSISRGFVQFGTSNGLFVYRNRDLVAPTTALTAPADGATVSGPVQLSATASDARGAASVTFRVDGQVVGVDMAPDAGSPFNPASPAMFSVPLDTRRLADGAHTVTAEAADGTLTATSPARRLTVANGRPDVDDQPPGGGTTARVKAKRITAKLRPKRDRRAPYRFTVAGRVTLPSGLTRAQGCGQGRVSVQYKAGRKTISTRRARLTQSCTYRSTVRFKNAKRFGGRRKLTVRVRFLGNDRLRPERVKTLAPRVR